MGRRWIHGASLLAALLITAGAVLAADEPPSGAVGDHQNVRVTLTITKTGEDGAAASPRVFKLIGQDDSEASMMVGWRTPIPMTSAAKDDPSKTPTTSYIYQNVGVNAKMLIHVLSDDQISLRGSIEISGARDSKVTDAGGQKVPLIGTFQQNISVVVTPGKSMRIAEAPDPEGGTVALEIQASVLP